MKGVGMFVVSFRGLNFRFWSHLGCPEKTPLCLAVKVSFRVAREKLLYFLFVCVLKWSLLGGQKSLGHAQIGLLQGINSKFPTSIPAPFIRESPPGGQRTSVVNFP